jgi:hypothetical protein
MRFAILAALAATGLGGCRDPEVTRLEQVKQSVCACKTASCVDTALRGVPTGKIVASHRAQTIANDMLDCVARAYDAGTPSTDPDAPAGR